MHIQPLDTPAAGNWPRDCQLIKLTSCHGLTLYYNKESNETFWSLNCRLIVAYKVISEEFSRHGYLLHLPTEGAFFEVFDSPWILEFGQKQLEILNKCKHYVLRFYDETIEVIAQEFSFQKLVSKPLFNTSFG